MAPAQTETPLRVQQVQQVAVYEPTQAGEAPQGQGLSSSQNSVNLRRRGPLRRL